MGTYTLEEADFLIEYYAPRLKERAVDPPTNAPLHVFRKELKENELYSIRVATEYPDRNITLTGSLDGIAKSLGLLAPPAVLKSKG